ncbi:MAG: amidohydrolase family protein [Saprospiraceae bacterium]|nr:amidohydrolase family protein [Saprospiraceae bacterium]
MRFLTYIFLLFFQSTLIAQPGYDIVIQNGRVMDPETGLDAVRNIGINGERIAEITTAQIRGYETIDAQGQVVAPGFIDLHVHGMTNEAHEYQVRDGVTTALELEGGVAFLEAWIESKRGNSLVNYGATVPHGSLRAMAMQQYQHYFEEAKRAIEREGFDSPTLSKIQINMGRSGYQSLAEEDLPQLRKIIEEELGKGALGIGVPVGYYPGAKANEMLCVYQIAAAHGAPVFSHTRGFGLPGINEAIANATVTGAPLHIVHANSLSLSEIQVTLDLVRSAQDQGLDVSTEVYPYTAASTSIESAIFDEGWQEELGISYEDLQWEETGERLTEETFHEKRKSGGIVIIHMMKPEWIKKGIADDRTMIGSDGMPFHPKAHPRTAGTFSRVLGKYVREEGVTDLMSALAKMTIMPARRLEQISPMMSRKGRLQVGADADITIFDPNTIIDRADFKGLQFSEGISHVLVNGKMVVREGETVSDVFPGRAIIGKYRN